jgi:hypothetical protein
VGPYGHGMNFRVSSPLAAAQLAQPKQKLKGTVGYLCKENKLCLYSENLTKHLNTLCGKSTVAFNLKVGSNYDNNFALSG